MARRPIRDEPVLTRDDLKTLYRGMPTRSLILYAQLHDDDCRDARRRRDNRAMAFSAARVRIIDEVLAERDRGVLAKPWPNTRPDRRKLPRVQR